MKKLITLLEISSSEFRANIKGLGHSEKGSELTSGGDLNADFLEILTLLFAEWEKTNPNCNLIFTSGNDAFHKKITDYVSRHTKGEAVDVTLDQSCRSAFITLLNTYKSKYNGFSFIDEYTNPTSKATGGHFHISYRKGDPEGSGSSNATSTTSTTATTNTPSETSKFSYSSSSSDNDGPNDEFTQAAERMTQGFVNQATDSLGFSKPKNESISIKEKRLIENIQKIKKLL
jgi:D-alanyl-D-alanine dipeptidase